MNLQEDFGVSNLLFNFCLIGNRKLILRFSSTALNPPPKVFLFGFFLDNLNCFLLKSQNNASILLIKLPAYLCKQKSHKIQRISKGPPNSQLGYHKMKNKK